jgi:hypothetical protein
MFLVVYTEAVFTSIHCGIDITTPQNLYVKLLMLGRVWLPASTLSRLRWCELCLIGFMGEVASQAEAVQRQPSGLALLIRRFSLFLSSQAGTVREGRTACIRWEQRAGQGPPSSQPITFSCRPGWKGTTTNQAALAPVKPGQSRPVRGMRARLCPSTNQTPP